ncbi:hypothetical protein DDT52_18370 [Brenneria roseae subsp. roseae]|nr:hypothetical protein DDT52_18370 [Brenneria roseae subsp. roseae]
MAAFIHPSRLLIVSARGFTRLPPSCTSKSIGYARFVAFLTHAESAQNDSEGFRRYIKPVILKLLDCPNQITNIFVNQ